MYLVQGTEEPQSFDDRDQAIDEAKRLSTGSKHEIVVRHGGECLVFQRGRLKQYIYEALRKGGG